MQHVRGGQQKSSIEAFHVLHWNGLLRSGLLCGWLAGLIGNLAMSVGVKVEAKANTPETSGQQGEDGFFQMLLMGYLISLTQVLKAKVICLRQQSTLSCHVSKKIKHNFLLW